MNRLLILALLLAGCVSQPKEKTITRGALKLDAQQHWTNTAAFVYPSNINQKLYKWQLQSTTNLTDWEDYNLPIDGDSLVSMPADRTNAIRLYRMHGTKF